ncbi:AraC family transcriptional regulator [Gilvimarinus sp. SDUM040013]|uniref:AraC family transcriptional regulator n=1 Tax=Gilvimarinus gilvus TaxID=3058038 RepID=A0ABU4S2Y5_9GAMM|nr:AraC family transcriptional regulator [Gilvimarinus sp. SDUM040013]MDO3384617.1 AraC family transcriptional regulator [Gilvimarinus sp. SDUM040013]MDX6850203.1 AraC family transcriptional regulator [Gilvimarinus sp. SDUM040013]
MIGLKISSNPATRPRKAPLRLLALALALCAMPVSVAAQPANANDLADNAEALKQQSLQLNRDLLILEEELLFPASSQMAVYLSLDVGDYFGLDSVKVKLDDDFISSELYTKRQVDALHRGGIQKLYVGNLRQGEHEISAFFTGIGPNGQAYKRATSITIEKTTAPLVLELKIVDSSQKLQPVFDIKQWEL